MMFLSKGNCEVYVKNMHETDELVRTLHSGSIFGEVALIAHCKRTASVKSKDYCTLAALDSESFYEMC